MQKARNRDVKNNNVKIQRTLIVIVLFWKRKSSEPLNQNDQNVENFAPIFEYE